MAEIPRKVRRTPAEELRMLRVYEQAYVGYEDPMSTPEDSPHHPAQVLTDAEINDPSFVRLWQPRNFLGKVIEEPVGYLGMQRPRLNITRVDESGEREEIDPDDAGDKRLQQQVYSFYERAIRPRQADLVLWQGEFGRSFAKITWDPGTWRHKNEDDEIVDFDAGERGLHVVPYPRFEGGIERAIAWHDSEDPDRVTSAAVFWLERDPDAWDEPKEEKHAQLLYPDRIEWLKLTGSGWVLDPDRSASGTGIDPHPWGVVPIAVCWNNGKPDAHDGLEAQAVVNHNIYTLNAAARTTAFPQRWRKGLIPPGGWHRNPLTGQRETVEPLRSGPYVVWDVPEGGEVGQLAAGEGMLLVQKYNSDLEDLATLTRSLAVAKMKTNQFISGESKHLDTVQLLKPRLQAKAEGLAACIRDIYRLVFRMAEADPEIRALLGIDEYQGLDIEAVFEVELEKDDQTESQLDQQDRNSGNMSLYSYLQRRGFSESEAKKEIERLATEEKERMERAASADPYGAGEGGFGAEAG